VLERITERLPHDPLQRPLRQNLLKLLDLLRDHLKKVLHLLLLHMSELQQLL
jgi:hypothetical protein